MKLSQWNIHQTDEKQVKILQKTFSISTLCARLLVSRGLHEPRDVAAFLQHDFRLFHDPRGLQDMNRAMDRIHRAFVEQEKIAVFGDYDVDGITSTYILSDYLKRKGARCTYYIPDRMDEGYGVNEKAVDSLINAGVTLIITVDTGITAHESVFHAKERGCDMIITDHHECRDTLPEAVAVINPHRKDSNYPFPTLAGVGVAFKLICALEGEIVYSYLPFVCMGTIADVMPLCDENRAIAYAGLQMLEKTEHVGLRALMIKSGIANQPLTADSIGFTLAPRINAAGRMQHASQVLNLFYETNIAQAEHSAQQLCLLNQARQEEERRIFDEAIQKLPEIFDPKRDSAIVLVGKEWHHGVLGIVASRLCNQFQCPVILLSQEGEIAKGSGRSIGEMNLYAALDSTAESLIQYGGHEMAVGLTISCEEIPAFRRHINVCAHQALCNYIPKIEVDFAVRASELSIPEIEGISVLEPFGTGNTPPLLCVQHARVEAITVIGKGRHLKVVLSQGDCRIEGVYFGKNEKDIDFTAGDSVDVLFRPGINDFHGKRVQLRIKEIRPIQQELDNMCKAYDIYIRVRQEKGTHEEAVNCSPNYHELGLLWRAIVKLSKRLEHHIPLITLQNCLNNQIHYEKIFVAFDVFTELGLLTYAQNQCSMETTILPIHEKVHLEDSKILRDIALRSNGMMI